MFNTPYSRVQDAPEKNSGEIVVEKAGYIPAEQQIKNLIRSGEDLMRYRKGLYNAEYGGKDDKEAFANEDPTLNPNFDIIDAFKTMEAENKRLSEKLAAAEKEAAVKKDAESKSVNDDGEATPSGATE